MAKAEKQTLKERVRQLIEGGEIMGNNLLITLESHEVQSDESRHVKVPCHLAETVLMQRLGSRMMVSA